jgi:hypothetical protein
MTHFSDHKNHRKLPKISKCNDQEKIQFFKALVLFLGTFFFFSPKLSDSTIFGFFQKKMCFCFCVCFVFKFFSAAAPPCPGRARRLTLV